MPNVDRIRIADVPSYKSPFYDEASGVICVCQSDLRLTGYTFNPRDIHFRLSSPVFIYDHPSKKEVFQKLLDANNRGAKLISTKVSHVILLIGD